MRAALTCVVVVLVAQRAEAQTYCDGSPVASMWDGWGGAVPVIFYIDGTEVYNPLSTVKVHIGFDSCTGTVIGPSSVLTALHCVDDNPSEVVPADVTIDDQNNCCSSGPGAYAVSDIIEHPNGPTGVDLAILTTVDSLPVLVNRHFYNETEYLECNGLIAQGLGAGIGFAGLREIPMRIDDPDQSPTIGRIAGKSPDHIDWTSGPKNDVRALCAGDSGGPVYALFDDGVVKHVGTAHTAGNCINEEYNTEEKWIESNPHETWINANIDTTPNWVSIASMGASINLVSAAVTRVEMDVSSGPQTSICQVIFNATANPVSMAGCVFKSPNGQHQISCVAHTKITHASGADIWECNIIIPQNAEAGVWLLDRVFARDTAWGVGRASGLEVLGVVGSVDLRITSASGDSTGPTISAVTVVPNTSVPADSDVVCTVTASDSSGVMDTSCTYEAPAGGCIDGNGNPCVTTCVKSGGGSCILHVPAGAQAGKVWAVKQVASRDMLGNMTRTTTTGDTTLTIAAGFNVIWASDDNETAGSCPYNFDRVVCERPEGSNGSSCSAECSDSDNVEFNRIDDPTPGGAGKYVFDQQCDYSIVDGCRSQAGVVNNSTVNTMFLDQDPIWFSAEYYMLTTNGGTGWQALWDMHQLVGGGSRTCCEPTTQFWNVGNQTGDNTLKFRWQHGSQPETGESSAGLPFETWVNVEYKYVRSTDGCTDGVDCDGEFAVYFDSVLVLSQTDVLTQASDSKNVIEVYWKAYGENVDDSAWYMRNAMITDAQRWP